MSGASSPKEVPLGDHVICFTREDLRDELQTFASQVIEPQLSDLAARMQKDLREQLQSYAPTSESSLLGEDSPAETRTNRKLSELAGRIKQDLDSRLSLKDVASEVLRNKSLVRRLERKHSIRPNAVLDELMEGDPEEQGGADSPKASLNPRTPFTSTRDTMLQRGISRTGTPHAKKVVSTPRSSQEEVDVEADDAAELVHDPSQKSHRQSVAGQIVRHLWFERVVIIVIVLNAIYIGVATDIMATQVYSETPMELKVFEYVFLSIFILELGLRFWVHGCSLFRRRFADGKANPSLYWNVLDCTVIILQLAENAPSRIQTASIDRISVIRILRLIRLVRLIRVIKIFRFVRDLRMIVYAIGKSLSLFLWAIVALALMNYTASVMFTEMALGHRLKFIADGSDASDIERYFGSLMITMLSMFQAVTGGMDWGVLTDCFQTGDVDSSIVIVCLVAYVAFTQIALLNVITGVFLDTAMDSARDERDAYVVRNARVIFQAADYNKDGTITWPDFERALDHPDVQNFFEAVDIHVSEAKALFDLLDASGDGTISADEFLNGCLRVRGPSKALDLLVLSREMGMLFESYAANSETPRRPSGGVQPGIGSRALSSNIQRASDSSARAPPQRKGNEAPAGIQSRSSFTSIHETGGAAVANAATESTDTSSSFDPVFPGGGGRHPGDGGNGTLSLPGMCSTMGTSDL